MIRQKAQTLIAIVALCNLGTALADENEAADGIAAKSHSSKALDLRAPDITTLYSPQQIAQFLAKTFNDNLESVEVEGERDRAPTSTPTVWGGLAAPFWALVNPVQAWRIFAPLPPDQVRRLSYEPPRATNTFLAPAAPAHL